MMRMASRTSPGASGALTTFVDDRAIIGLDHCGATRGAVEVRRPVRGDGIGLGFARETDERPQPVARRRVRRPARAARGSADAADATTTCPTSRRSATLLATTLAAAAARRRARRRSAEPSPANRSTSEASARAPTAVPAKLLERIGIGVARARRGTRRRRPRWCARRATRSSGAGRSASTWRTSAARTASSSGVRPCAASAPAPSSSARRSSTMKRTLTMPPGRPPSSRRSARPVRLPGTITVTGASGSPSLAAAMMSASASVAARPNGTVVSRATPPRSMTQR